MRQCEHKEASFEIDFLKSLANMIFAEEFTYLELQVSDCAVLL